MTRINELQYANCFIQWLNKKYSLDYQIKENSEENSEVDAYAISKSKCYPKLNLQVTTSHGEIFKHSAVNTNCLKKGKDIICNDVNIENWIHSAIEKKAKNKYSPELQKDLILLIEGHIPTPTPDDIPKLQHDSDYPFKGIYYVSLPVYSSIETEYTKNGFVVPIKDIFAQNENK